MSRRTTRRTFVRHAGLAAALPVLWPLAARAQSQPVEGRHYQRLPQPLPGAPGKIEVVEFFWYGCPHCYVFEPTLNAWAQQAARDVVFRHVHVMFRPNMVTHQKTFLALQAMGQESQVRAAIFDAIHRGGRPLDTLDAMSAFLAARGLDAKKFREAFNAFGLQALAGQADKLAEAYGIEGVPSVGVGGRFLTSPGMAGGEFSRDEEEMGRRALAVIGFLLERVRKGG